MVEYLTGSWSEAATRGRITECQAEVRAFLKGALFYRTRVCIIIDLHSHAQEWKYEHRPATSKSRSLTTFLWPVR